MGACPLSKDLHHMTGLCLRPRFANESACLLNSLYTCWIREACGLLGTKRPIVQSLNSRSQEAATSSLYTGWHTWEDPWSQCTTVWLTPKITSWVVVVGKSRDQTRGSWTTTRFGRTNSEESEGLQLLETWCNRRGTHKFAHLYPIVANYLNCVGQSSRLAAISSKSSPRESIGQGSHCAPLERRSGACLSRGRAKTYATCWVRCYHTAVCQDNTEGRKLFVAFVELWQRRNPAARWLLCKMFMGTVRAWHHVVRTLRVALFTHDSHLFCANTGFPNAVHDEQGWNSDTSVHFHRKLCLELWLHFFRNVPLGKQPCWWTAQDAYRKPHSPIASDNC